MKKIFSIILLTALSLTAVAQQKKVAVYVTGEQSGVSKVLGDQLVAAFAKSGRYTAVERTTSFLAELSKEQSYQRSGAVSDSDIARLGYQFGVQYVCVADITDVFGETYISARLIYVETAEIVNTYNVRGKINSMDICIQMAAEIAEYLSKGTLAEQEQAERIRKEELRRQGYIDLGLPSGTLWKDKNERKQTYFDFMQNYKPKLPTKEQFIELKETCKWTWMGNGYNVEGPNGESIFLPIEEYWSSSYWIRDGGLYMSSTEWEGNTYNSVSIYALVFYSSSIRPDRKVGGGELMSIRLVK